MKIPVEWALVQVRSNRLIVRFEEVPVDDLDLPLLSLYKSMRYDKFCRGPARVKCLFMGRLLKNIALHKSL